MSNLSDNKRSEVEISFPLAEQLFKNILQRNYSKKIFQENNNGEVFLFDKAAGVKLSNLGRQEFITRDFRKCFSKTIPQQLFFRTFFASCYNNH